MKRFAPLIFAACAAVAGAENISGTHTYPQFRNVSALSGGMFGVLPSGKASIAGAMAISTPIGYSLGKGVFAAGIGNMSNDQTLRFFSSKDKDKNFGQSNGTGYLMEGFRTPFGALTVGGELLSLAGDTCLNLQWQAPTTDPRLGLSVGVQDTFGVGGSAGEGLPTDGDSSTSYFGVGTYQVNPDLYVSLGAGTRRFKGVFGNVSYGLSPKLKAVAEYDTYNWNGAVAYDAGSILHNRVSTTIGLGTIRGKNTFFSVGFNF